MPANNCWRPPVPGSKGGEERSSIGPIAVLNGLLIFLALFLVIAATEAGEGTKGTRPSTAGN